MPEPKEIPVYSTPLTKSIIPEQKGLYASYLHDNIGRLNKGWPLAEGYQRVVDLEEELASEKMEYSMAMIMNFCSVKDRFGEAHGLDWLAPGSDMLEEDPDLLRGVDVYIYIVDLPKCNGERAHFRHIEPVVKSLTVQRYTGAPDREEQSSYFRYIVDHYDDMHDFVIFVHPDAPEHQGKEMRAMTEGLRFLNTKSALAYRSIQYYPLAMQYIRSPLRTSRVRAAHYYDAGDREEDWPVFWNKLFLQRPNGVCPSGCEWNPDMDDEFTFYIASQAIVRADRVRIHPRSWYGSFFHQDMVWFSNNSGLLEAAWPVIMGEDLTEVSREADKRLPLALKFDMLTKYSYGWNDVI